MNRLSTSVIALLLLTACGDGQPFFDTETPTEETDPVVDPTDPVVEENAEDLLITGTVRPPQSAASVARGDVARLEANTESGGLVSSVEYIAGNDTFVVDGLGFDGANTYQPGGAVGQLRSYSVYDADTLASDTLTGSPIGQIVPYRAIYGVSNNTIDGGEPRSSFAIVRTGGYVQYGFGGFIYERNGPVTVPTTGQAGFNGDYAGLRVFTNQGGLEFTQGQMALAIDFRDFDNNNAVIGRIYNREAFDEQGNVVPLDGTGDLILPQLIFTVRAGGSDIRSNGEFSGELTSTRRDENGALEIYESGTYFAVIAGDATAGDGGEVVGVIVVESEDPRIDGVSAQETGGFILYRN